MSMTKDETFARHIEPLVRQVSTLCREHGIEFCADFLLEERISPSPLYCSSFNIQPHSTHRLASFVRGINNG